jgi:5'-3' exonuclease
VVDTPSLLFRTYYALPDSIKGPDGKGVGPKTAAELLRRHGSLEAILDNAIREQRPRLRGAGRHLAAGQAASFSADRERDAPFENRIAPSSIGPRLIVRMSKT